MNNTDQGGGAEDGADHTLRPVNGTTGISPSCRRGIPRWGWGVLAAEGSLIPLGWLAMGCVGLDRSSAWKWEAGPVALGLTGAIVPGALFVWVMKTRSRSGVALRQWVDQVLTPLFREWSLPSLALLSLLAGWGEEFLFRGFIQGWLTQSMGIVAGLLMASVLFGLCHALTRLYALLATGIGLWLGWLYSLTDNLLVPALTHAVYDFAVLWVLRSRRGGQPQGRSHPG